MKRHYNLYYLFWEDQAERRLSEKEKWKIQKIIENFYKKLKPPWLMIPPSSSGKENIERKNEK